MVRAGSAKASGSCRRCSSCISPSQLSRPRRGTQPRSWSLHLSRHRCAASSTIDNSSSGCCAAAPVVAPLLLLTLRAPSWMQLRPSRSRSSALGRKDAIFSSISLVTPLSRLNLPPRAQNACVVGLFCPLAALALMFKSAAGVRAAPTAIAAAVTRSRAARCFTRSGVGSRRSNVIRASSSSDSASAACRAIQQRSGRHGPQAAGPAAS